MADTKHGFLVLADISGFTAFVTETELEHGPPIVAALLEEVIQRISPPLEIQEVEGDAVFAFGLQSALVPPDRLLGVLHAGFVGFRERREEFEADDSCSCNACRSVGRLRLKAIGHYGTFLAQTVGPTSLDSIHARPSSSQAISNNSPAAICTTGTLSTACAPESGR